MATKLWTNTADFSSSNSPTKLLISNAVTLRQYLDVAETCAALPDETSAWNIIYTGTGNTITVVSGAWRFSLPAATSEIKRIALDSSTFQGATDFGTLTGDFDIQIDFANLSVTGSVNNSALVALRAIINGNNLLEVQRRVAAGVEQYFAQAIFSGGSVFSTTANSTDTTGKLRITRSGNTVAGYYWNGSSWTTINSGSAISTPDLDLNIHNANASGNTGSYTVDLDNLTINSGTKVNWYYRDSPSFACTELDTGGTDGTVDKSTFNSTFTGTGSREYRWKSANSSGGGSFSAWLTQAGMTGASGPTGTARYWNFEGRLISDGTQTASDDAVTIDYSVGVLPPGGYWYWQQMNARRRQTSLVGV